MSNRNINTVHILSLLINNGVHCNGSFSCLAITNNQLSLSSTNWNHSINCLNSCLQWCVNRFSLDNAMCHTFNSSKLCACNWSLAINRLSKCIDNSTCEFVTHRNFYHSTCCLYCIALADVMLISKQNCTNIVLLKV